MRDELDAIRASLLAIVRRKRANGGALVAPDAEHADELDALHARNVRIHGAARAEYVRWAALMKGAALLREWESRRKDAAMVDALDALERAKDAEEGEARWLRVGVWLARRVDEAAARLGKRTKLVTRIDFSPAPAIVDYGEALEVDDLETIEEEDEIKW